MTEETVNWYIQRNLHHSVHTSARRSFRSCRRRWNWAYREYYYPRVTPKPLEFGIAYHKAMERYYDPKMWEHRDVSANLAVVEFSNCVKEQLKNYRELNGEPDVEVLEDYQQRTELGRKMIQYYTSRISPELDKGLTPIAVEVSFEIPLELTCKCKVCWNKWGAFSGGDYSDWAGLPVTFGGRIDAVMRDMHGRIWPYDWKAQPLDSGVLAPNGWVRMGDLKVGDQVVGSNGKPALVTGIFPQGIKEVYKIKTSDGAVAEATLNHLWTVECRNLRPDGSRHSKTVTTRELIKELEKIHPKYVVLPELDQIIYNSSERRYLQSIEYSRTTQVQCITVDAPDQLYVTDGFLLTHNSTNRILDGDAEASFLELDDQVTGYCVALWRLGYPVWGFIYHEQKKAVPDPPEPLTRLYKGRKFSTSKSANTDYQLFTETIVKEDYHAYIAGIYDEYILWLKTDGPKFFQRHQVHRNQHQLKNAWNDLLEETQDMINDPRVYPQPGRFSCNTCSYRQPCLGMNMGEDYQYTLNTMFERKDRHYYEEDSSLESGIVLE